MKQGWEIKKLGDIAEYFNGLTYTPKDVNDKGTVVLRSSNIQNDKIDFSDIVRVNASIKDKLYVKEGDILMCSRNGSRHLVGKTAPILSVKEPMTFGTFMMIIRSKYNPYLIWFFKTDEFKKQISGGENTMINQVTRYMLDAIVLPLPSVIEQKRIVGVLDSAFAKIDELRQTAEQNLQNAKDLFQASLKQELAPKQGWESKSIKEISKDIFAGGDAPQNNFSEERTEKYNIPIYANAVKDDGLYGFTDFARVMKPSLTIAARGSGTGHVLERKEAYLPIVRLIVIVPKEEQILLRYLYYSFRGLDITRSGSAIPQLTVPMIKCYTISFPSIEGQKVIVEKLDALSERCRTMEENYRQTIALCNDLKQVLLTKAFNGEL